MKDDAGQPGANRVVLVVEDEGPLLSVIEKKLESVGFRVLGVKNVIEAKQEVLKASPPVHAIWLDHYLLGKETGLDFLAWLKETEPNRNIPVFVVSNTASPEKRQSYMQLGATKYYVKAEHTLDEIVKALVSAINES